jgi:hypothetical protein
MPLLVPELSEMRADREGGRKRREKVSGERRKGEITTAIEQREPAPMTFGTWVEKK